MSMLHVLLMVSVATLAFSDPACLDANGDPVDFWYAVKYPNGWEYAYLTAADKTMKKGPGNLDDGSSLLSKTLQQVYEDHTSLSYAMWNDEHPDGPVVSGHHAHAKGVVAMNKKAGFWLTHSLPKFPAASSSTEPGYSGASDRYGQSYLCVTATAGEISKLGSLLMVNWPSVYDMADNADAKDPFNAWAGKQEHTSDTPTKVASIGSRAGQAFVVFAKSGDWDNELYENLVAPHFGKELLTETWQNGRGKLESYCPGNEAGKYPVENVVKVEFPSGNWKETSDHSKWAVSSDGTVFCVGDINRQEGQFQRGGGTVCIDDSDIASQFRAAISDYEACPSLGLDKEVNKTDNAFVVV